MDVNPLAVSSLCTQGESQIMDHNANTVIPQITTSNVVSFRVAPELASRLERVVETYERLGRPVELEALLVQRLQDFVDDADRDLEAARELSRAMKAGSVETWSEYS